MKKENNKVYISISFKKFVRTRFTVMQDAISFVKKESLINVRLRQKIGFCEETWDNF